MTASGAGSKGPVPRYTRPTERKIGLRDVVGYRMHEYLLGGMLHQFSFLTALMLSIIIPGGLALQYFNGSPMHTAMRESYQLLARLGGSCIGCFNTPIPERMVRNALFMLNICTMSIVIGLISSTVKTWVDKLINANTAILERGHCVIIAPDAPALVVAVVLNIFHSAKLYASQINFNKPFIILTSQPKAKVQAAVDTALYEASMNAMRKQGDVFAFLRKRLRVVVREGDPQNLADLHKVSVADARSVTYISTAKDREQVNDKGKASVKLRNKMKSIAALLWHMRAHVYHTWGRAGLLAVPGNADNWGELAARFTACEEAKYSGRMVSLLAPATSLGLSQVYNEIFALGATYSFFICDALGSKDEAGEFRWLHGVPFKDVQAYFPKAVVAGVLQADNTVKMGADALVHTLSAGDKLILLASAYGQTRARRYARRAPSLLSKPVGKVGAQGAAGEAAAGKKGKGGVVVLGSNERSMTTLKEITALVPGAAVSCEPKNYMNAAALEAAGVLKAQTVIVLSESNTASNVDYASDSELLGIVETLAALQWGDETERPRIVGMVASPMTYKVLESKCQAYGFKADLVLADSVEAGSISQVVLMAGMEKIFNSMLAPGGTELHLWSASECAKGLEVAIAGKKESGAAHMPLACSFHQIQESARAQGKIALGVLSGKARRILLGQPNIASAGGFLSLNPGQKAWFTLSPDDSIVVLGELSK
eukprot:Tamp_07463.p1 GENE.Tamp_07463~~Tamp_07463.p1  ORF type:complete len:756 (+),score=170.77 Tamp_07463:129-2270(+)